MSEHISDDRLAEMRDTYKTAPNLSSALLELQERRKAEGEQWRDISTASKDGEFLAVWPALKLDDDGNITDQPAGHKSFIGVAYSTNGAIEGPDALNATGDYYGDDWEYGQATLWMPIPALPENGGI